MAATIENNGDIDVIVDTSGLAPGSTASMVFRTWDDATPPFRVKVKSPSNRTILERVIRELPTGKPMSAAALTFDVKVAGAYKITINELYGKQEGDAVLKVT